MLKKRTLNPEITLLFMLQFHAQKALFKVPKICNINFWIENDPPPPLWHFSEKSSNLVAGPFPKDFLNGLTFVESMSCEKLSKEKSFLLYIHVFLKISKWTHLPWCMSFYTKWDHRLLTLPISWWHWPMSSRYWLFTFSVYLC